MATNTTHVIEIEAGIGEPSFIPIAKGTEIQPISLGRKGMWRLESQRVLDIHAFVYFDGEKLFVQSADDEGATAVDGQKVGKTWTELSPPCRIEVGAARLRYRALHSKASTVPPAAREGLAPQPSRRTGPLPGPKPPPVASARGSVRPGPPPPLSFPKNDRPFAPGAFVADDHEDSSTRKAPARLLQESQAETAALSALPLDRSLGSARPSQGPAGATMVSASGQVSGQASAGATQVMIGAPLQSLAPPQPTPHPGASHPYPSPSRLGTAAPSMPPANFGPGASSRPAAGNSLAPFGPQAPMAGAPAPLAMGAVDMGAPPFAMPMGASLPPPIPSAYPSPGGGGAFSGRPTDPARPKLTKKYKQLNLAQRILVVVAPISLLAAAYVLYTDDARTRKLAAMDVTQPIPASAVPTAPPTPATCPPGFQPFGAVQPGAALTCVPIAASPPPVPMSDAAAGDAHAHGPSLERQAVDHIAAGDYPHAAAIYAELVRQYPDNRAYAEALRILRGRTDAGL